MVVGGRTFLRLFVWDDCAKQTVPHFLSPSRRLFLIFFAYFLFQSLPTSRCSHPLDIGNTHRTFYTTEENLEHLFPAARRSMKQITELSNIMKYWRGNICKPIYLSISAARVRWALSLLRESFESITATAWCGKTWLWWRVRGSQHSRKAKRYSLIPPFKKVFNSLDRSAIARLFKVVNDEVVETNKVETVICFKPLRCIC